MNIHSFFNFIILALSLATIILTLGAFFVHKIRQVQSGGKRDNKSPLEGLYFDRYAPHIHLNEKEVHAKQSLLLKHKKKITSLSATFLFGITTLLILASLLVYSLLRPRTLEEERQATAERYKYLMSIGLLKKHPFDINKENPKNEEFITAQQEERAQYSLAGLKDLKIAVLTTKDNKKHNKHHKQAINFWKKYFKIHDVDKYNLIDISDPSQLKLSSGGKIKRERLAAFDLVLAPQLKILNEEQRKLFYSFRSENLPLLVTGPLGAWSGKDTVFENLTWTSAYVGQSFKENKKTYIHHHSMVASKSEPWWDIPPGILLKWEPLDQSFHSLVSNTNGKIMAANSEGHVSKYGDINSKEYLSRYKLENKDQYRFVWSALDPRSYKDKPTDFYAKKVVASTLLWLGNKPQVKIAAWPNGFSSSFVFSADIEDKFIAVNDFVKAAKENELPTTLFIVSDMFKDNKETAGQMEENIEVASHSDDHKVFEKQKLKKQFLRLQNSRLDIEGLAGSAVQGFRPPKEEYDETTLNALLQNDYQYIFADQQHFRFAPLFVEDDFFLFYPRTIRDDYHLVNDLSLGDMTSIKNAMMDDFNLVHAYGGAYLINVHTQHFGQQPYFKALADFLAEIKLKDTWKTTFLQMSGWWRQKNNIFYEIKKADDKWVLTLTNKNEEPVSGATVYLNGLDVSGPIERNLASENENQNLNIETLGSTIKIIINELPAKDSIDINFNEQKNN